MGFDSLLKKEGDSTSQHSKSGRLLNKRMKFAFVALFLILGGILLWYFGSHSLPLQCMAEMEGAEDVLISRARPRVFFRPSLDMHLVDCGWKTVRPDDGRLDSEGVRVSFATYKNEKAMLITCLAQTPAEWEWVAAHHVPFTTLHSVDEPYERERIYESVFLLSEKNNPFAGNGDFSGTVLVYRGKFLLFFRQMQAFFEYHEAIDPKAARILELDPTYLRDFAARARESCTLAFPLQRAMDGLKTKSYALNAASDTYSRTKLAVWLGEIKHPGNNR